MNLKSIKKTAMKRTREKLRTFGRSVRILSKVMLWFCLAALVISCISPALAVTPQQGWYITGDTNLDGVNYWIISNSGDTIGYYVDLSSVSNHTYGGTRYLHAVKTWQGFSQYEWAIDSDWIIKASVTSFSPVNCYFVVADRNYMARVINSSSVIANGEYVDGYLYVETSPTDAGSFENPMDYTVWGGVKLTQGTNYIPLTQMGYYAGGHNNFYSRILINDLVITVASSSSSGTSATNNTSAHLSFVFLCPKDKAPAGMQIGDEWPKIRSQEVNIQLAVSQWEQRQLNYSNELLSYGKTTSQLGALGSANNQIVSDVTDNAIGQFGVSNDQINNIADMLTGSFYLHVLTISGLFIVLLFFIKKGMA